MRKGNYLIALLAINNFRSDCIAQQTNSSLTMGSNLIGLIENKGYRSMIKNLKQLLEVVLIRKGIVLKYPENKILNLKRFK